MDLDRNFVDVREIKKMGRKAVDSNEVFIDGLPNPAEDLIGEEGKGFRQVLHGLNPERILMAGECTGIARNALTRAAQACGVEANAAKLLAADAAVEAPEAAQIAFGGFGYAKEYHVE